MCVATLDWHEKPSSVHQSGVPDEDISTVAGEQSSDFHHISCWTAVLLSLLSGTTMSGELRRTQISSRSRSLMQWHQSGVSHKKLLRQVYNARENARSFRLGQKSSILSSLFPQSIVTQKLRRIDDEHKSMSTIEAWGILEGNGQTPMLDR